MSLIIRKRQIKITMRCHFTPIRMTEIRETDRTQNAKQQNPHTLLMLL